MPIPSLEPGRAATIRGALLRWYDDRCRDLPWRRDRDPYRVWVSEVMLQQTRVGTVVPYYERWLARFPTVRALADSEPDAVLAAWAGLGYYRRARALHEAARVIRDRHAGRVPEDLDSLRALPGVGAYTAGAIASIAFDRAAPAVDTNARRVLARLFDVADASPAPLEALAGTLVRDERPGDLNQALMELGATVCSPRAPACGACPVARRCLARARGTIAERPAPRARRETPSYLVGTAVVTAGDRVLVARRSAGGMLGGMWEFPGAITADGEGPAAAARRICRALLGCAGRGRAPRGRPLTIVEHAYSHRRHAYHAYRYAASLPAAYSNSFEQSRGDRVTPPAVPGAARWTDVAWPDITTLEALPMGAAQRRIGRALMEPTPAHPGRRRSP